MLTTPQFFIIGSKGIEVDETSFEEGLDQV